MAMARGENKPARGEPKNSIGSLAKVLLGRNRDLLTTIASERPASLTELAEVAGRSKSNLS